MSKASTITKVVPRILPAGTRQEIREMSVEEWILIADNPRQRNTERHIEKAKVHLSKPSPTHSRVAMAMTERGDRWKLDGHTRALGWQRGMFPAPPRLYVDVYLVRDAAEAKELYTHFDNVLAVETAGDQVSGGWRELGFTPQSSMLRAGSVTNALRLAAGLARGTRSKPKDMTIYEMMRAWLPEMRLFDDINPHYTRFTSPLVCAALMTFRKHGESPSVFWQRYSDDAGEKVGDLKDPVETLSRFMMETRQTRAASTKTYDVVGKGLAAYEAHRQNRSYTRGFIAMDPTKYLPRDRDYILLEQ